MICVTTCFSSAGVNGLSLLSVADTTFAFSELVCCVLHSLSKISMDVRRLLLEAGGQYVADTSQHSRDTQRVRERD